MHSLQKIAIKANTNPEATNKKKGIEVMEDTNNTRTEQYKW